MSEKVYDLAWAERVYSTLQASYPRVGNLERVIAQIIINDGIYVTHERVRATLIWILRHRSKQAIWNEYRRWAKDSKAWENARKIKLARRIEPLMVNERDDFSQTEMIF